MSGNAGCAFRIVSGYAVTFGITLIAAFGQITGGLAEVGQGLSLLLKDA